MGEAEDKKKAALEKMMDKLAASLLKASDTAKNLAAKVEKADAAVVKVEDAPEK